MNAKANLDAMKSETAEERIIRLRGERDSLRLRRDEAERRAATMLACGDQQGWKDWSDEAATLCDKLSAVNGQLDAAYEAVLDAEEVTFAAEAFANLDADCERSEAQLEQLTAANVAAVSYYEWRARLRA